MREVRQRGAVGILTFVVELGISRPMGRPTDVLGSDLNYVVVGQILSDPLFRAWRSTDASPSADLHQCSRLASPSLVNEFAVWAGWNWSVLGRNEFHSFRKRLLGLR